MFSVRPFGRRSRSRITGVDGICGHVRRPTVLTCRVAHRRFAHHLFTRRLFPCLRAILDRPVRFIRRPVQVAFKFCTVLGRGRPWLRPLVGRPVDVYRKNVGRYIGHVCSWTRTHGGWSSVLHLATCGPIAFPEKTHLFHMVRYFDVNRVMPHRVDFARCWAIFAALLGVWPATNGVVVVSQCTHFVFAHIEQRPIYAAPWMQCSISCRPPMMR